MRYYLISLGKFVREKSKKVFKVNLTIREFPDAASRDFAGKEVGAALRDDKNVPENASLADKADAVLQEVFSGETVIGLDTKKQDLNVVEMRFSQVEEDHAHSKAWDDLPDITLKNIAKARKAVKRGESLLYLVEIYPDCTAGGIARYTVADRDTCQAAAMDYAESIPGDVLEIEVAPDGGLKIEITEKVL